MNHLFLWIALGVLFFLAGDFRERLRRLEKRHLCVRCKQPVDPSVCDNCFDEEQAGPFDDLSTRRDH